MTNRRQTVYVEDLGFAPAIKDMADFVKILFMNRARQTLLRNSPSGTADSTERLQILRGLCALGRCQFGSPFLRDGAAFEPTAQEIPPKLNGVFVAFEIGGKFGSFFRRQRNWCSHLR